WWQLQQQAAQACLEQQGHQHGFRLIAPERDDFAMWAGDDYSELQAHCGCVQAYQQHRFVRKAQGTPITFCCVDFSGALC
ncbi:type I-E CRISPR-associated protein Cas6/Cse3/CasE, partial [Salmonella enterica]|uniref:type I-E CRISPR-associated protein Cas6/Cse3/CasE n=1 Tax=Salmonella enterica TaxID=28901 RepID=UPI00329762F1